MSLRLPSGDLPAFKLLLFLAAVYGLISLLVHSVIYLKFVTPLASDAPLDRFSEARAIDHIRFLTKEIDGRQEGKPGLKEAARYIKAQLELIKERAGSSYRIEIEETTVGGSFNMLFLGYSISLAYKNHTNIIMRMSAVDSLENDTSVLINGHFDSPLSSPGAADCGSCVASMMELARQTVDSGWVPPHPIIFLFNGAEELFLLGAHGFMKTHKWRDSIGAAINIEASGTGGPDMVCQSGPGSWPSRIYGLSAIYPMGNSAAQDVFPVIPGDTDYRMFSQDYSDIPGLDIIFLLGGYFYHTSYDTVERILPGSIQARGDNLISIVKAFASSSELRNAFERESLKAEVKEDKDERAVFFDYLSFFMIYYSKREAMVLHSLPIAIFLLVPFFLRLPNLGFYTWFATFWDFVKGTLFHASAIILGIIFPIIFSILRLLFSSHAMNWFAHPYLAFMMFIPPSLIGQLIPITIWSNFPLSQDVSVIKKSKNALSDEARFWGAFGLYAIFTLVYLLAGLSGGFLTFSLSVGMLPAWILFSLSVKAYGQRSLRSTILYVIPLIPFITYAVYFGGFLVQFLVEKMGMMGSISPPYGFFVPDIIVAATIGAVTGWSFGPILPVFGHWLGRSAILKFLLHLTVIAMALSSQFFPYSIDAPKRVVLQHTFITEGESRVVDSSFDFSVVDSNSLSFLFKNAPEVSKELHIDSDLSYETFNQSHRETWQALYPVGFLFSRSLKFHVASDDIMKQYIYFPRLSSYKPHTISDGGSRKVHLEFSLGSLEEVWVAVLNITGPLSSWSFADNKLPAPETSDGGPPSYIIRLSGFNHENWTFWLEASSTEGLRVEVAVLDQRLGDRAKKIKELFPEWADITAYTSFLSTYTF